MSEPEYIARGEADDPRLVHVTLLATLMDRAFRIPGTPWRFGLDAIIGLIPGLGDMLGSVVGAYSLWIARQLGAPASVQLRMVLNLAIDGVVGLVPLAGDVFDFAFKAHSRNQALIAEWLSTPRQAQRSSIGVLVLAGVVLLGILGSGAWLLISTIGWLIERLAP